MPFQTYWVYNTIFYWTDCDKTFTAAVGGPANVVMHKISTKSANLKHFLLKKKGALVECNKSALDHWFTKNSKLCGSWKRSKNFIPVFFSLVQRDPSNSSALELLAKSKQQEALHEQLTENSLKSEPVERFPYICLKLCPFLPNKIANEQKNRQVFWPKFGEILYVQKYVFKNVRSGSGYRPLPYRKSMDTPAQKNVVHEQ